jgi:hypothetical protein
LKRNRLDRRIKKDIRKGKASKLLEQKETAVVLDSCQQEISVQEAGEKGKK